MAIADAGKRKQKHTELLKREHFRYKGGGMHGKLQLRGCMKDSKIGLHVRQRNRQ